MKSSLAALLILAVLTSLHVASQRKVSGGWEFAADSAYLDQAVAQSLARDHTYGMGEPAQPVPALRDSLWRVILGAGEILGAGSDGMAVGAAAVLALMALFAGFKFASTAHAASAGASVLLLAVAAGWPLAVVSGTSDMLAAFLVVTALWLYLRGYLPQEEPVPLIAALPLGLACALRIEFIAIWLVVWLHALCVAAIRRGEKEFQAALVRGLNGGLLIALLIAPIIAWNMKTLGVPWPRLPEASLALDDLGGTHAALVSSAIPLAFAKLHALSCLQSPLFKLIFWIGLVALLVETLRNRSSAPNLLPAFLYLLAPVMYGALTPILGWGAAPIIFKSLNAVWIITAVRGVHVLGAGIMFGLAKIKPGGVPAVTPSRLTVGLVVLLAAVALRAQSGEAREQGEALRRAADARRSLADAHAAGQLNGTVAVTDQPGWLARQGWFKLVDLGGETSIHVLSLVQADGTIEMARLLRLLQRENADLLILWTPKNEMLKQSLSAQAIGLPEGAPYVGRVAIAGQ